MNTLEDWRKKFPDKFAPEETAFQCIHRGDTIFIGTACAEPQYLVQGLIRYVESNPKAFFDAEVLPSGPSAWPPMPRRNSSIISATTPFSSATTPGRPSTREWPTTRPIFLSQVPDLFHRGLDRIDVALIQTSPPDEHGYMSLGVSVDIVKAAVEMARCVIAQVNDEMPRVHGDAFIHIEDVDYHRSLRRAAPGIRARMRRRKSPSRSASTWPGSSRTATRSRSATAAFPTPFWPTLRTRSTWGSTRSFSATAWSN